MTPPGSTAMLAGMSASPDIRPLRMYSDAERNAVPRALWGFSHWVDFVEAGAYREVRIKRLEEVPQGWRALVSDRVVRRAQRVQREGRPG